MRSGKKRKEKLVLISFLKERKRTKMTRGWRRLRKIMFKQNWYNLSIFLAAIYMSRYLITHFADFSFMEWLDHNLNKSE